VLDPAAAAGAGRGAGGDLRRRRRPGPRLSGPAGADGGAVRPRPVRRRAAGPARLYRSGDLARGLAAGRRLLEYLGRIDHQVKPLTINGKLDVAALPAPGAWPVETPPEAGTAVPGEAVESGDSVTAEILGLWSRILNTEVSIDDNFFEIGGNSLFVIRVLREMRDLGLPRVSTHEFYRHSTAARFIELVREQTSVEV
jgi:hypothetical protein